ncbi:hypothetical protein [Kribbella sp. NBC_00359]|uniref:hypothetical protein n=1 Tax=Kribbella sp. NBC_00359 TaxID=2975966 RepID=UPI002E24B799
MTTFMVLGGVLIAFLLAVMPASPCDPDRGRRRPQGRAHLTSAPQPPQDADPRDRV